MAYTVENIFKRACSLVDSMTDAGEIDANTTADYRGRTLTLTDIAQKELLQVADNYKQYEISRTSPKNMFGNKSYMDVLEYKGGSEVTLDATNDDNGSVKAYYFESDSTNGTAYIEDYNGSWNTLATISMTNTGIGFNAYSGVVTPTSGATLSRIRFTGANYYRYVNVALYNFAYLSSSVPVYRAWIPIELPVDLRHIEKVNAEYFDSVYTVDPSYKVQWEGNRQTIYISIDFEGTLKVQYKPYPVAPTAFTDSIEVDDLTAQCICYYLAMNFVATEQNTELVSLFRSQYENLKAQVRRKQPISEIPIVDYYSDTNSSHKGVGGV